MDADALTKLITLVKGQPSTTKTTSVSAEGMQAMLQNILQSTQGLAAVTQGQKSSGLYNSSVNTQMVNDLLTRASAQVAANNSTTTVKTAPQVNKSDLLTTLGLIGGKALLGPTLSMAAKKSGVSDLGQKLSDAIFGTDAAATVQSSAAPLDAILGTEGAGSTLASDIMGVGSDVASAAELGDVGASIAGAETGADVGTAAATGSSLLGAAGVAAGGAYGAEQVKLATSDTPTDSVDTFFPGVGQALSSVGDVLKSLF